MELIVDTYILGLSIDEFLGFLRKIIPICFIFFITTFATILVKIDICAEYNPEYTVNRLWSSIKTKVYFSYFYIVCLLISIFWYIFLTTN